MTTRFEPDKAYSCLFSYTEAEVKSHRDEIPERLLLEVEEWKSRVIPEEHRTDENFTPTYLPPSHLDRHDPRGERGYYGVVYSRAF